MQSATAYEWRGRIFLHAYSKTTDGVWILSQPVLATDPRDLPELGRAILSVLAGSRQGVPHPSIWGDWSAPLLECAGTKSHRAFYGSARKVGIKRRDDRVTITPMRNLGTRDGYQVLKGKDRNSSLETAHLGAALLSAFQDAE